MSTHTATVDNTHFGPMTKREVLIARHGYVTRALSFYDLENHKMHRRRFERDAEFFFPLPKVRRPRVVRESGDFLREYRVVDDRLEYRSDDIHDWTEVAWNYTSNWTVTPERARIWADLFANPTEEVEAE